MINKYKTMHTYIEYAMLNKYVNRIPTSRFLKIFACIMIKLFLYLFCLLQVPIYKLSIFILPKIIIYSFIYLIYYVCHIKCFSLSSNKICLYGSTFDSFHKEIKCHVFIQCEERSIFVTWIYIIKNHDWFIGLGSN